MRSILTMLCLLGMLLGAAPAAEKLERPLQAPEITKEHPRLFVDAEGIQQIRQRIREGVEPTVSSWAKVQATVDNLVQNDWQPKPYTGEDAGLFYKNLWRDASATRDLALAWQIGGNEEHARRAIAAIIAWTQAKPLPASHFDPELAYPNAGMLVARSSIQLLWAYDLLYQHPDFDYEDKMRAEGWFRLCEAWIKIGHHRWAVNDYFDKQYFQNHLAADAMTLTAIGYALNDRNLVQYALDSEKNDRDFADLIEGMILMEGDEPYYREPEKKPVQTGEIIDRYRHYEIGGHYKDYVTKPNRGLQYCILSLNLMSITAELHYQHGLNMFEYAAPGGENLELVFSFYAPFYAAMDSSLQGGFYAGETERMTGGGDFPAVFEFGHRHYPENERIIEVLIKRDRTAHRTLLLGWPPLLYGEPLD